MICQTLSEWEARVKVRDNFTCQRCGAKPKGIHAHHIKKWRKFPELKLETNNGVALCSTCHAEVEQYAWSYTDDSLQEFKDMLRRPGPIPTKTERRMSPLTRTLVLPKGLVTIESH